MHPKVDEYIQKSKTWRKEFEQLRGILLACQLTEEFKWRQPCYTFQGKNIAIIGGFKAHCVLGFFKGSLLADPYGLLTSPGGNTQSGRHFRFTCVEEISNTLSVIKAYIFEAIEIEKAGSQVTFKPVTEYAIPDELLEKFAEDAKFKLAFNALTPGRQKGYLIYFSAPKQSKTRWSRIEGYAQSILAGKGLHDCTCGMSKRLPNCDGSHRYLEKE